MAIGQLQASKTVSAVVRAFHVSSRAELEEQIQGNWKSEEYPSSGRLRVATLGQNQYMITSSLLIVLM